MVLGKRWLFLIGNGAKIRPLDGQKIPCGMTRETTNDKNIENTR